MGFATDGRQRVAFARSLVVPLVLVAPAAWGESRRPGVLAIAALHISNSTLGVSLALGPQWQATWGWPGSDTASNPSPVDLPRLPMMNAIGEADHP